MLPVVVPLAVDTPPRPIMPTSHAARALTILLLASAPLAAQLVVPRFAAWAAVSTTYEHAPRLMAVAHGDESRSAALRVALSSAEGQVLAERLIRELVEQRPILVPATELPLDLGADRSGDVLAVPLVARRRLLGLLLVGRTTGSSYAADDVGLLTDLARRAALAVDNARLYEERTSIAHALQASLLPPARCHRRAAVQLDWIESVLALDKGDCVLVLRGGGGRCTRGSPAGPYVRVRSIRSRSWMAPSRPSGPRRRPNSRRIVSITTG